MHVHTHTAIEEENYDRESWWSLMKVDGYTSFVYGINIIYRFIDV